MISRIKINGDDSLAGMGEYCGHLASLSAEGLEEWNIRKLTLPITYGRYKSTLPKTIERLKNKKGNKHSHVYKITDSNFDMRAKQIAQRYVPMVVTDVDIDEDDL